MISFTEADTVVKIICITSQYSKKLKMMNKYLNVQKIPVNYWAFLSVSWFWQG